MYGATKIAGEYLPPGVRRPVRAAVRDAAIHERLRAAPGGRARDERAAAHPRGSRRRRSPATGASRSTSSRRRRGRRERGRDGVRRDGEFNVGSGAEASVGEIVDLLLRLSGSTLRPEFRKDQKVLMRGESEATTRRSSSSDGGRPRSRTRARRACLPNVVVPSSDPQITEARIPITKPLFGAEELEAVQRPLETGWVVQGPFVAGSRSGSPLHRRAMRSRRARARRRCISRSRRSGSSPATR